MVGCCSASDIVSCGCSHGGKRHPEEGDPDFDSEESYSASDYVAPPGAWWAKTTGAGAAASKSAQLRNTDP